MNSVTVSKPTSNLKASLSNCISTVSRNISYNVQFYKKGIITALMINFILLFIFTAFVGFCSYDEADGLAGIAQGMVIDIFGGGMIDDVKSLVRIEFDSTTNVFTAGGVSIPGLSGLMSSLHRIFKNLGYMLLIAYFLIGLMEDISFNQVYMEKLVKKGVFFCLGIALISNSMNLVYGIANIGSGIVSGIGAVAADNMPSYDALCQEIYDKCSTAEDADGLLDWMGAAISDLGNSVAYVIQLILPYAVCWISRLIVLFTCWSRFIEILILAIMSPLSFADISKGSGDRSNAMRAVKNVIALSFSGAAILLICVICSQIQGALVTTADFATATGNCVLISVVQMGLVGRANDIVKQALGMA